MSQRDCNKVVVAMSGGVDSSVAALLLSRAGHELIGVSMQVWDYRKEGSCESRATCCAPADFMDARRVAGELGFPYYVFDFEETFQKEVIDRFVQTYQIGQTPNPCVECNNWVKFKALRERAESLGIEAVATGHYAQVAIDSAGPRLLRGKDSNKDQSYFLYGLNAEELKATIFPVGMYTKEEVREIARDAGLKIADKEESQDICFVAGSHLDFIRERGVTPKDGPICAIDGRVLGKHNGIEQFTVGQRRGVGIGGSEEPLYVVEIDSESGTVFVGPRAALEVEGVSVVDCNWIAPEVRSHLKSAQGVVEFDAIAQLRHRHGGVPVRVKSLDGCTVEAQFVSDWATVTPGQAAVFYDLDNREVLGGGKISRLGRKSAEKDRLAETGVST